MAYKFQLGTAVLSGSLIQEGAMEASGLDAGAGGLANAGAIAGATSIDGSGDLTMGTITMTGFTVDADGDAVAKSLTTAAGGNIEAGSGASIIIGSAALTEAELEMLDGISAGTVAASKAVVVDGNKDVSSFRNLTGVALIGSTSVSGALLQVPKDGLKISDVAVTATAAELNLLDGVAGLVQADFTKLAAVDATAAELNYLDNDDLEAADFVKLAALTATAAELNYLDNDALTAADITKLAAVDSTAAELNLLDAVARGSFIYGNASGASALLAKGTAHQFLQSDGTDIAYVSMSGDATLSAGAITISDNAVTLAKMAGLARGKFIYGDASGDPAALAAGGNGKLLVADANGDPSWTTVSGDATLSAGALTISAEAVEGSMLNNNIVSGLTDIGADFASTDEIIVSDNGVIRRADMSRFSTMLASTGLDDSSGQLRVSAAQTAITSIINASIGKIGTAANQEYVDFSNANEVHLAVNGAPALVATATGVTVEGNLTVLGTTSTVNSTTINISSSFTFEGPADDHETILTCATPAADTTIQLPEFSSAGTYYMAAFAADPGAAGQITATPAELNLLDAGAGSSADLADGDGFLMFDASDSNNAEKVLMSDIKSYVGKMAIQNIDNSGSCVVGMNFFSSHGGHEICTLPASPDVGNIVYIKAASDCSSVNNVSIKKAGSQTIDGQDVIILESPDAAISLCYVEANKWKIF